MSDDETDQVIPRGAALALMLAAERLIAERGSDIVTARDITEAAGVANTSAINYHFGTREALLLAVFEYRVGGLNRRRHAYLLELAAAGNAHDQRSLVGAMIYPLAEELLRAPEGTYYLRFIERIRRERARDMVLWARHHGMPVSRSEKTSLARMTAPEMLADMASLLTSWVEVERDIARTLAWLPPAVAGFRVQLFREQAIGGLASIEEMVEMGATLPADVAPQIEMVIDGIVAMLTGPISPGLAEMLGLVDRR